MSPAPARNPAEIHLDDMVCFPLYAAARAVTRTYADLLETVGLTYPQYLAMLALWESEDPLSVRQLGSRLKLDSGTLTPLLKRLEAAGLVTRRRDVEDERRVLVAVTERGAGMRAQVADVPARLFAAMSMSMSELTELRSTLRTLLDNLEGRGADAGEQTPALSPGAPASSRDW